MATGGTPFDDCADDQELHNWTVTNGSSLEDRLNNMDWGIQQKAANRLTEKNRKKFSAGGVAESRLTNDISPESTPGTGRRRTNTPHSFPHVKYTTQMSVPDQAELDRLRQRINFTDLDERSVGSDSQGRVTAANNQRELAAENKKPFKFLPLHVNTNKSRDTPSTSAPATPSVAATAKKQSPGLGLRDALTPSLPSNDTPRLGRGAERGLLPSREDGRGERSIDSSQVVSKLVQIREYIGKASSMRDDLVEKNDIPANVERLTHLIAHLKEQERSYLRFLQKMLARENEEDEAGTLDSAVGSGSLPESTTLNIEVRSSDASNATGRIAGRSDQKEELENLRKQHELLKKMLEQQEQLRALQGRQAALLTMQHSSQQATQTMADTVPTETTGSVSGLSITSELNDELNDLIQRFHNQLHDSQTKAAVPDNRRQAASLSLSREVCRSRSSQPSLPSRSASSFLHPSSLTSLTSIIPTSASAASAKLTKLQELQDKKQTMDKILQELHSLRDQTLNNNSCRGGSVSLSSQRSLALGAGPSSDRPSALYREPNGASAVRRDPSTHTQQPQHEDAPADKLRKLKEVHKRLNELRELVQYYEQTSDMMVDTVNENVKEDEETEEETEEDGSMLETMFDSEQENRRPPITNIRNPQHSGNWTEMNSLTNGRGGGSTNNHVDGRLNTECEINNRSAAANLRSLNIPSAIECQYNRPYNQVKDDDDDDALEDEEEVPGVGGRDSEGSGSSRRSSLENEDADFAHKVHRLQTAKQKLRQLQELVAMVQSDDTDATTADEGLHQQPNNTRGAAAGCSSAGKSPRDLTLTDKAREKLYEEKLCQQQQELQQLHEERQRLMEIQDKIQDLQWACPDLQSSVSSSTVSQQALMRKPPAATSTPAPPPAPAAAPKANASPAATAVLKPTAQAAANASVTDNEQLWCEMRRHQILREELRQRRKHLESLMAEHQRRSGLSDSPYKMEDTEGLAASQPLSRDERTMATWGGSTPCQLDEDGYPSEMGAEEEEEEEDGAESSSSDDLHLYSTRKQRSYSNRKALGSNVLKPPQQFASVASGRPSPRSRAKQQQQQSQAHGGIGGARRQENLRWAAELSFQEGSGTGSVLASNHWQEQVGTLQRQLDFSTSMCQTLLQDQQTLSYMLQTLLTGPYNALPNNLSSPQVHLVMHQLSQCYTQLAWQQNNAERLKLVLSDLLRRQQQQQPPSSSSGQQAQNQGSTSRDSGSACPPFSPTSLFLPFISSMPPSVNQALHLPPGLAGFSPLSSGFNFNPLFPSAMGEFPQSAGGQVSPDNQQQQLDPNTSVKTEYLSFPPPLQCSPFNTVDKRPRRQNEGTGSRGHESGWLNVSQPPAPITESPSPLPHRGANNTRPQAFDQASQESFSSMPDPADPTIVTKAFRAGRKASAQASLASRDKTPNSKRRTRLAKGHHKNTGVESDSVSSTANFVQERVPQPHRQRDQNQSLLDKLTQEKLDTKTKTGNKPNDLSSAYAWRTPFLSNRIACTEAPDASSDFSLFEALRETIYSEVATLISQNESRPHFLIELFHELQLLNTDYLRQRALYTLEDIVTRHLTEKSAAEDQASTLGPVAWAAGSQSELTPSESLATSDGDVSEKNIRIIKHHVPIKRRNDAESVDNESTLSTTSNLEPFANDDLGNTVIHLDKALARMREYERMKLKAEFSPNTTAATASEASANSSASAAQLLEGAGVWSGDVHCPQIDTQQLDRQIKAIMTEVIPFLKEHMDEVCSYQLLTSVRHMVLTLTQQNDESKEFVRFFHRQLGGILQDSLSKFAGRTLKDCGEDLLVEISEILFNELAFFRLMQDLDSNSSSTATIANSQARHKNHKRPNNNQVKQEHRNNEEKKSPEVEKSFSPAYLDEDKDEDETEQKETEREQHGGEGKDSRSSEASETEEEDGVREGLLRSISLSKAETPALTNYGSGEDENEVQMEFEAEPQDVQTSLQASNDGGEQRVAANEAPSNGNRETKSDHENSESNDVKSSKSESIEMVDSPEEEREGVEHGRQEGESQGGAASTTTNNQEGSHSQGSNSSSSPDTESPVMLNIDEVGSGNMSQKSDEEDFVKVEDLPMQLSVICEEALQKRVVEEQQNNNLSAEILNGNTDTSGLVGNGYTLKEPETIGAQSA
ncbi:pericentriolar material 1 protein isoform X1 [Salmo trutta]|uniref:Pericentriolar material 1 n=1 Tax=Salmo trutta TaxID=8032 RepID=A0A674BKV6_SALTR|nr:pericentriolar material 1 protein-like isoform X1 [Salmo trutta]XP_029621895.1 pericentriolar material 1 protein-like isoform X1 [Salmo trutta]XP_029621896.1 pericentriolar material 1 protein-like isoform X1 [Salmo trutta]XP_029621897.1 pericentriolar material 1 protein-like isoform X1 [Salmo trutta]